MVIDFEVNSFLNLAFALGVIREILDVILVRI